MKRLFSVILSLLAISPVLSLSALAEGNAEAGQASQTAFIVIAAVLSVAAILSVILVNKKTAKYRKAFGRKRKGKRK